MTRVIKWATFPLTVQRFSLISCHLLSQLSCMGLQPRCDCLCTSVPPFTSRSRAGSQLVLPLCRDEVQLKKSAVLTEQKSCSDRCNSPVSIIWSPCKAHRPTYTSVTICFLALLLSPVAWKVAVWTSQHLTLPWLLGEFVRLKGKVLKAAPTAPVNADRVFIEKGLQMSNQSSA